MKQYMRCLQASDDCQAIRSKRVSPTKRSRNVQLNPRSAKEKISTFECRFNSSSRARLPFRTQFFIIRLIFLIFDTEIALLLPLIFISINFNPFIIS
ncbi:NADH-ubiquinone oxidoreductase chain 3 [Atta colombica]|uniref:NADH-ubiquinone oxidoreductase chain 3 n=1 Tax=Atta colombica TaxID=520822 RepID=A0A151I057_9HYME|nr:NADH-ubiquinone oxidoreductase chain 3 [Atta colombica]